MSIQKIITYNPVNLTGEKLDSTCELKLKILENSGNYLVHKDILRHNISTKQGTSSTKTRSEVRGGAVSHGNKKVQDVLEQVQIVHLYGKVVV